VTSHAPRPKKTSAALGAWILAVAAHAWFVYGNKPISESEIKREIERQAGPGH
jgi:hypothetical protein